jgi:hypothetical protein
MKKDIENIVPKLGSCEEDGEILVPIEILLFPFRCVLYNLIDWSSLVY